MALIEVLAWVAAATAVGTALPQLWRIVRLRTSSGVSLIMWQLGAAGALGWSWHGYYTGQAVIAWPNLLLAVAQAGILWAIRLDRGTSQLRLWAPSLLLAASLSMIDVWLGPVVFGSVVMLAPCLGLAAQLKAILSPRDIEGVSSRSLAVGVLANGLWLVYGVANVEWAVRVAATTQLALTVATLTAWVVRTKRMTNDRRTSPPASPRLA